MAARLHAALCFGFYPRARCYRVVGVVGVGVVGVVVFTGGRADGCPCGRVALSSSYSSSSYSSYYSYSYSYSYYSSYYSHSYSTS